MTTIEPFVLAYSDQADALLNDLVRRYRRGDNGGVVFEQVEQLPHELVTTALMFAARSIVRGEAV